MPPGLQSAQGHKFNNVTLKTELRTKNEERSSIRDDDGRIHACGGARGEVGRDHRDQHAAAETANPSSRSGDAGRSVRPHSTSGAQPRLMAPNAIRIPKESAR
jgi:hypothetical protein